MSEPLVTAALTRVGIIGDVHTEDKALASTLAFLQSMKLDAICCVGDIVTGPGDANRCCHLLETAGVYTVRGNHDRWFFTDGYIDMLNDATTPDTLDTAARAFLETLPVQLAFDTPRGPLLLSHGTGSNDMIGVYPGDSELMLSGNWKLQKLHAEKHFRILIGGHTHQRMVRPFEHLILINPGTLRRRERPGFVCADFHTGTVTFFDLQDGNTICESNTIRLPDYERD